MISVIQKYNIQEYFIVDYTMVNLTNYPYPTYESNKSAAIVFATLIGISLIAWIVQSIQAHFQPRRPSILILIAHLTIFVELVLRAALSTDIRNSRAAFTVSTILCAVGQRIIIVANNVFLTQVGDPKPRRSRLIIIGSIFGVASSGILLGLAGAFSHKSNKIEQSFQLRQASAAIVLCMTIFFYPLWFATKTVKDMTKQAIVLLIICSVASLMVAIFLQVTSVPDYYVATNAQEFWFYIFQITPIAIALFTWTILHPKRSILPIQEPKDNLMGDIDNPL
jgi:cytochrome bd-type quinol oxidase subunit 2